MKKFLIYGLLITNFCVLLAFWWHFSGPLLFTDLGSTSLALGRLAGLVATNLILLQIILIGRTKWVESVFGLDKLSRIHRLNGYIILALVVMHPILITQAYAVFNQTSYFGQYWSLLKSWNTLVQAFIGYIVLMATIVLSITIVRRRLKYESWYFVHLFNYAAIALIFGHQLKFGTDGQSIYFRNYWYAIYIFTFANLIWFRIVRPLLRCWRHRFIVERVVTEPGPATSIYITGKQMEKFKITAGQFMIFRFLQKGFWWQAHPFSMSEAPRGNRIRLTAKALGDYTRALPEIKPGTKVIIDGPHGVFTEQKITQNKLLFIAGGIGITPIYAMIESMGTKYPDKTLLYANKTRQETVFGKELDALSRQHNFKLVHILNDEEVPGYEHGRLDQAMIARLVPDAADRDIFLCGPPPMMLALRKSLMELGVSKSRIFFERFAL